MISLGQRMGGVLTYVQVRGLQPYCYSQWYLERPKCPESPKLPLVHLGGRASRTAAGSKEHKHQPAVKYSRTLVLFNFLKRIFPF